MIEQEDELAEEIRLDAERDSETSEEGGPVVYVCTRAYRRKHGHEPRGRFLWSFRYGSERLWFTSRGEYADCRDRAIRRAAARGTSRISVSSVVYSQDPGR